MRWLVTQPIHPVSWYQGVEASPEDTQRNRRFLSNEYNSNQGPELVPCSASVCLLIQAKLPLKDPGDTDTAFSTDDEMGVPCRPHSSVCP